MDLCKSAGSAAATSAGVSSKQTLVDGLVQVLCPHRSSADTAADAFLAALRHKLAEQPADAAEEFCRAELQKLKTRQRMSKLCESECCRSEV